MLITVTTMGMVCTFGAPPDSWHVLRAIHSEIQDAEFVYEGALSMPPREPGGEPSSPPFSGKGRFHQDGVVYYECMRGYDQGNGIRIKSIRKGARPRTTFMWVGGKPIIPQTINSDGVSELTFPTSFFRIWPVGIFPALPQEMIDQVEDLGEEEVDGHVCRVLKIPLGEIIEWRMYFDLDRGGNVLRWERFNKGHLMHLMHSVVLQTVTGADSKEYWIPTSSKVDGFITIDRNTRKRTYHKSPPRPTVEYRILSGTVKINRGVSSRSMEISADARSPAMSPEELADVSPPPAEHLDTRRRVSVKDLNDAIETAEQQIDELEKSRLEAPSRSYAQWAVSLAAIACIAAAIYIRVKQGRAR